MNNRSLFSFKSNIVEAAQSFNLQYERVGVLIRSVSEREESTPHETLHLRNRLRLPGRRPFTYIAPSDSFAATTTPNRCEVVEVSVGNRSSSKRPEFKGCGILACSITNRQGVPAGPQQAHRYLIGDTLFAALDFECSFLAHGKRDRELTRIDGYFQLAFHSPIERCHRASNRRSPLDPLELHPQSRYRRPSARPNPDAKAGAILRVETPI